MRRSLVGVVAAIVILTLAGCGGSEGAAADGIPATETTATQTTVGETEATQTTATQTTATKAPTNDAWTTVVTLRSSDPFWQDLEGLLISEPFTVSGEVRVVLDMPDAGQVDGVIVAIVPEEEAADVMALLAAIGDATVLTMIPAAPTKEVTGLDGTYVLVNSVPASKEWSLELQTRP
jgi:hypothetical protein